MKSILFFSTILLTCSNQVFATMTYQAGLKDEPTNYDLIYNKFNDQHIENLVAQTNSSFELQSLERKIEMQKKHYEERIAYLQAELKKAQTKVVENAIAYQAREKKLKDEFKIEKSTYTRDIIAKNKTILEYNQIIDKFKLGAEAKELIETNNQLAIQLRAAQDQIAGMKYLEQYPLETLANKEFKNVSEFGTFPKEAVPTKATRLPASVK